MSKAGLSSGSIPDYTPQRAYMFQRERDAVRSKLEKTIDFSDTELGDAFRKSKRSVTSHFLNSEGWNERMEDCARHSNLELTADKRKQVNNVARELFMDYLECDKMNQRVMREVCNNGYSGLVAPSLVEIYVNHVTREGLSKLKDCGFSDKSAMSLCGNIIKKVLTHAKGDFAVQPSYDPSMTTEHNLERVNNYWNLLKEILNDNRKEEQASLIAAARRAAGNSPLTR